MADETRRITYEGSPAFAGRLVQFLKDEGVTVDWTPPMEERGVREVAEHPVVVTIIANGTWAAITAGARKFRERFKGRVEIEGEDD